MSAQLHRLSNGIPVAIDPMPHVRTAYVNFSFKTGSALETAANNGVAHFIEHMVFKGTKKRDALALVRDIEQKGASINADTDQETTRYYTDGPAEYVSDYIEILGDMISHPVFPRKEINNEKGVVLCEVKDYSETPESVSGNLSRKAAYKNHPQAMPIEGKYEIVRGFDQAAIRSFYDQHYHAGNLVITVSGKVNLRKVLADLEKAVGSMKVRPANEFPAPAYHGGMNIRNFKTATVDLNISFNSAAYGTRMDVAADMLTSVMSDGFASRLNQAIRESRRGLAYSISASQDAQDSCGLMTIHASVEKQNTKTFFQVLGREIKKICSSEISDEEFERARAQILGNYYRATTCPETRGDLLQRDLRFEGKLTPPARYMRVFNSITKAEIREAAQKIFASKPAIGAAGACKHMPSYDAILATMQP